MADRIDLDSVATARADLAATKDRLTALRAEWRTLERTLDDQVTAGAPAARVEATKARLTDLAATRTTLRDDLVRRHDLVGRATTALLTGPFVDDAVSSMDGRTPFLLLPVRIETRFRPDRRSLLVRIFPDDIHIDDHLPGLTDAEVALGRWYWERRWERPDDADVAEAAWNAVVARRGEPRGHYLIELLRPDGDVGDPDGPTFPDVERRPAGPGAPPVATALPERWAAIGMAVRPGRPPVEICRVWSERVRDDLPVAPDLDVGASSDEGDDGLDWIRDPTTARRLGMLVEITQADLTSGHDLADGFDRLLVVGADWTRSPEETVTLVDELMTAHHASGRLSYLAQGTPTNVTGAAAELPGDGIDLRPPAERPPTVPTPGTASDVLERATGLRSPGLAAAPGAGGREQRWTAALVDGTWEATAGYFLGELLDPVIDDDDIEQLRRHAADHLRPGGPLPLLRIDRQPYGILPVTSSRGIELVDEPVLAKVQQVADALRAMATSAVQAVPELGDATDRDTLDDVLLELLQRTPVAWTIRTRALHDPVSRHLMQQDWTSLSAMQRHVRAVVLRGLGVSAATRLGELVLDPRSHRFRLPFVQKGQAGTDYLGELATAAQADDGHQRLRLRQGSATVLEALLAFAGAQELERSATDRIRLHLERQVRTPAVTAALGQLTKRGVRTPSVLGIDDDVPPGDALLSPFRSGRDLIARRIDGIDADRSIGTVVGRRLADLVARNRLDVVIRRRRDSHRQLARYVRALEVLADAPPDELEWTFRGVLDCFATRLDAWITSLTTARLEEHRAERPDGLHLGCFGWLEDVRPDASGASESLGHVLAPSITQATAVAILRAGRQASDDEAFDLSLTSRRVRDAVALLDGLSSDQSLAALIGYRIERALQDAVSLARYILPLRELSSLASPRDRSPETTPPPAGDVVDGLDLLERWRADQRAVIEAAGVVNRDRARFRGVIGEVDATFDAVSDVLLAEAIHQLAAGNLERAGAAMRAHDRPERPGPTDVIRSPSHGVSITQRVVVATTTTRSDGWARDLRSRAEPRLDAWIGDVLGSPAEVVVGAELHVGEDITALDPITLDSLGLGPLSVVAAVQRTGSTEPNELRERLVRHIEDGVADLAEGRRIVLHGLEAFEALCRWAGAVASNAPIRPSDLLDGDTVGQASFDLEELERRLGVVDEAHRRSSARMATLLDRIDDDAARDPSVSAIANALDAAAVFEPGSALPSVSRSSPEARSVLESQLRATSTSLASKRVAVDHLAGEIADLTTDDVERRLELLTQSIRTLLGPAQPVLATFRLDEPGPLDGAVRRRSELLDGDDTAPLAWLHRMALVRPNLGPFTDLLSNAEADGRLDPSEVAVAQWPLTERPRWIALPHGADGPPEDGATSVVAHFPDPRFGRRLAGIVIDSWTETIPAAEATAGLSFHYDAPGARAPQAMLLAVHPAAEPDSWDFDLLVDIVDEAVELSRLRGVGPRELGSFAGLLPSLFLPDIPSREHPSIPLKHLGEAMRQVVDDRFVTGVLGKD